MARCIGLEKSMVLTQPYSEQIKIWPTSGRHILAQFDAETIIVYQAYNAAIGRYAIEHGKFGNGFSSSRMTWIKPNFLWMMYRSDWGTKQNQEITLALRLRRSFFDLILSSAVSSTWNSQLYSNQEDWTRAISTSSVRLQWDPDHDPKGAKVDRRAIQLGLRADMLESFANRQLVEVIDMTAFVEEQRSMLMSKKSFEGLSTPLERTYYPSDPMICSRLQVDR